MGAYPNFPHSQIVGTRIDRSGFAEAFLDFHRMLLSVPRKRRPKIGTFTQGRIYVSTIELPIAHGEDEDGRPFLYESMTFLDGSWEDEDCVRYTSYADAMMGHELAVERAICLYGLDE